MCEASCSISKCKEINPEKSRIRIIKWIWEGISIPSLCYECSSPLCRDVCPVKAIDRNTETGIVKVNEDLCIGCKLCVYICPFGNMSINEKGLATKCDLCDGDPQCVKVCPKNALKYVEYDEVSVAKRRAGLEKMSKLLDIVTELR